MHGHTTFITQRKRVRMTQPSRPPKPYRPKKVRQTYHVGPGGMPMYLDTRLTMVALAQVINVVEYVFDTPHVSVVGSARCSAGNVRPDLYDPGLFAVDLTLSIPVAPGQQATIEYRTTFHYNQPPPNELRQGSGAHGTEEIDLTVWYHWEYPPQRVWWDERDGYGTEAIVLQTGDQPYPIQPTGDAGPTDGYRVTRVWSDLPPNHVVGVYWTR